MKMAKKIKNPNDKCINCGHKRNKHRIKECCCLASDYYSGHSWVRCICEQFRGKEDDDNVVKPTTFSRWKKDSK
jgi:hypothetical protein